MPRKSLKLKKMKFQVYHRIKNLKLWLTHTGKWKRKRKNRKRRWRKRKKRKCHQNLKKSILEDIMVEIIMVESIMREGITVKNMKDLHHTIFKMAIQSSSLKNNNPLIKVLILQDLIMIMMTIENMNIAEGNLCTEQSW